MTATIAVDANPLTRHLITGTELYSREVCKRLPAAAPDLNFRFYAAQPAPDVDLDLIVAPMPRLVTAHIVMAYIIIGVAPFTRLVHILVVPNPYLWRRPQVVRWYRAPKEAA